MHRFDTLVWEDDFSSSLLDRSKWTPRIGNWQISSKGEPIVPGWGNNELQYYTDKEGHTGNFVVSDGTLKLIARKESAPEQFGVHCSYTSAKLDTFGKFSFTYGRVEMRARCDIGAGIWPAFWMLPEHNAYGAWAASGEIDIFEAKGRLPQQALGTIHYGGVCPDNLHQEHIFHFPDSRGIANFHTYELIWTPGSLIWMIDGNAYAEAHDWLSVSPHIHWPAPFDCPFYLILNLAVGGNFDLPAIANLTDSFPAVYEIDYIRVFQ